MLDNAVTKQWMRDRIMEWLDNDKVIERVYYFILGIRGT